METVKEDKILLAGAEDKFIQCCRQYRITNTGFLDIRQRSLVEAMCRKMCRENSDVRYMFYGGYEDAERTAAVFMPEYADDAESLISVIRVRSAAGGKKLTHRDYLGSLTGLGIRREMIGDILVTDRGADIIVMKEIEEFILMNYDKAGRTQLSTECIPLEKLYVPRKDTLRIKDTVASMRLDNVISSAFGISRVKASEAVKTGVVFVNSLQCEKADMQINEGDILVLRGKGKAVLSEVGRKTRKNRTAVVIDRYI